MIKKNSMTVNKSIKIEGQSIGSGHPPYIIAEMSANHNGELEKAKKIIEMTKSMGADAIKLQTYTPDTLTIRSNKEDFSIKGGLWDGYSLYDLYKEAHTPYEWHKELFDYAHEIGITVFSTAYDETAVDLLEKLGNPAYKIASFEVIDLPLIKYIAQTKKPIIMSTGMANKDEISEALQVAKDNGSGEVILLHCVSAYPTPIDQINLATIKDMEDRFGVITGLSDHTMGTSVSIAAVALGACVIEKHVCLSRQDEGVDSSFSMEPQELEELCLNSKLAWEALGKASYKLKDIEEENIKFRRSIYVVKDINKGDIFTEENIRRIRPGFGLAPKFYHELIGKKSNQDLESGIPMKWEYIEQD